MQVNAYIYIYIYEISLNGIFYLIIYFSFVTVNKTGDLTIIGKCRKEWNNYYMVIKKLLNAMKVNLIFFLKIFIYMHLK